MSRSVPTLAAEKQTNGCRFPSYQPSQAYRFKEPERPPSFPSRSMRLLDKQANLSPLPVAPWHGGAEQRPERESVGNRLFIKQTHAWLASRMRGECGAAWWLPCPMPSSRRWGSLSTLLNSGRRAPLHKRACHLSVRGRKGKSKCVA